MVSTQRRNQQSRRLLSQLEETVNDFVIDKGVRVTQTEHEIDKTRKKYFQATRVM